MSTVHVERGGAGEIVAVYANPQGTTEPVAAADPEVVAFLNPPPPIPDITARQLRLWLIRNGIALAQIDTAIDALPEEIRDEARVEWTWAPTFKRSNPLFDMLGPTLGLSSEQIDDGFRVASTY